MKDDSVKSKTIEWLRFFCAAAVVVLHSAGKPLEGNAVISCQYGAYDTIRILFSHGLCRVAVPLFFFISGYLFFTGLEQWNTKVWVAKLKRRCRTLLVPYILWNIISVLFSLAMLYPKFMLHGGDAPSVAEWFRNLGGLRLFWDARSGFPHNDPLWFIRDLIVLVVFTPVIYQFVKRLKIVGLALLYVAYLMLIRVRIPGLSLEGLFFFATGAYMSIRKADFTVLFKKLCPVAIGFAIPMVAMMVLTYGRMPDAWEYARRLFTPAGVVATIGIAESLFENNRLKVNRTLADSSFFIYAAHGTIVLPVVLSALGMIFPATQIWLIVKYIATPVLILAILLPAYWLLRKWMPRTMALLTGGRA